ncbi:MAG TPA: S8 family serine peptidase [Candidatus Cryosericum sp.]
MKGCRVGIAVFITICLLMSLVSGAGQAFAATAGSPPTAADVAAARADYLKSLQLAEAGGSNTHAPDLVVGGMTIPADVAATKSFAQGKIHVLITVAGDSLAKVSASRSLSLATMTKAEAAPAIAAIRAAQDESIATVTAAGVRLSSIMRFSVLFSGYAATIDLSELGKLVATVGKDNVHLSRLHTLNDAVGDGATGAAGALTDLGVDGTGAYVGVCDTGVDYTHPDFGGNGTNQGFPTAKVAAGYDFAGDNANAITLNDRSLIVPDADPMDTNGHGTHVCGIIAADGLVKGVAPKAKIVIAKISPGAIGSAYTEEIVAAWEYMADPNNLDEGPEGSHPAVQSVNMSFGSVAGFDDPTDPERIAIENAIASGIVATLSAGNSASNYTSPFAYNFYPDYSTLGAPAVTPGAISVASVENNVLPYWALTEVSTSLDYAYANSGPTDPRTLGDNAGAGYSYVDCGLGGSASDFPTPFPPNTIALIKRGTYNFTDKIMNASNAGAVAVIVYNNAAGMLNMAYPDGLTTVPAMFISQAAGEALKLKATPWTGHAVGDGTGLLSFLGHTQVLPNPAADTVSTFSSWGPTSNLTFKPEVTGPGGNIWSTVPVAQGSYANYSGTSMAAPYVAGVAALVRLAHPGWTVQEVKTALMNTGTLLIDPTSPTHLPYSPRLQGAGYINLNNALQNNVTVISHLDGEGSVALGSVESWADDPITFPLVLHNSGSTAVTYAVSGTVQWVNAGGTAKSYAIPGATFAASPATVVVAAGGSRTVTITVDATAVSLSYNYFPYVEGFVTFTPVSGVALHVPYLGYLGNWNDFDSDTWAPTFNPLIDLPYARDSYSANFYDGDLGKTGVTWPEDPSAGYAQMGKTIEGTFDAATIAINPDRTTGTNLAIQNNIWVLRNIWNLKVEIRDASGSLVKTIDDVYHVWKGDYPTYGANGSWYWSGNVDWTWYGEDAQGVRVPDGQYYLNTVATPEKVANNPGFDAPQTVSFPVFVDTQLPVLTLESALRDGAGHTVLNWSVSDPVPSSGMWGYFLAWSANDWVTTESEWIAPDTTTYTIPEGAKYVLYAVDNAANVGEVSEAVSAIKITSPAGLASVDGLTFDVLGEFAHATTGSFQLLVTSGAGEQVQYPFAVHNAMQFGPITVHASDFTSLAAGGSFATTLEVKAVGVGILPPPSPTVFITWNVPAFVQTTLVLTQDWNLISLPFEATLGDIQGATSGYGYQDSAWVVLTLDSTLVPGRGYWIQCSAAGSQDLVGVSVESPVDVTVTAGWNLIGDPFNAAVSFADVRNWDKVVHCYAFQNGAWTDVDLSSGSLEPGVGYWVEMAEATTLKVVEP